MHVHAIGDRAVREALDAFEGARPAAERRHHIAHLQVVHPDDVPRFAELGVAANMQSLWACLDDQMVDLTLPFLGEERASWQYPFGALQRSGARLVAGSDWPVSTPNPLEAIHVAVNRWAHGEEGREGSEPFLPEQALDLETAFAAYTVGLGLGEPPRRGRHRSRPARWPTSSSSTATRSRAPERRSAPRRSSRPGSTGRPGVEAQR